MQKKLITIATLGLLGGTTLFFFGYPFHPICALCLSDLEVIFLVVDQQTGERVSDATVSLQEELDEPGIAAKTTHTITGPDGKAVFLRDSVRSEEIIRPFRPTYR